MNLYINSPAYFTQNHGVIDEIYSMCSLIAKSIDIRQYTNVLDTIGITPIIAPAKVLNCKKLKEVKVVNLSLRIANISLISDYEAFIKGDLLDKKKIILENILKSLKVIEKKTRNQFEFCKIEKDIKELVDKM